MFKSTFNTFLAIAVSAVFISGCSTLKSITDTIGSASDDATDDEAQKHVTAEEWTAAIIAYDKEIAKTPKEASAWGWRAYCYAAANNNRKAIADATKAISLDPEADWAYDTRAGAYRSLKMYKEAVADYSEEIKLKPDEADNYISRADVLDDMKELKRALVDYDKALQIDSTSALALNNRGWCYLELGEYDKALDDFDACLEQDDKYTNAYYNRAVTNFRRGKATEALADLKHVIEDDPSEYTAYLDRGFIYLTKKEPDKALAEFNLVSDRIADAAGVNWGHIYSYLTDKLLHKDDDARKELKTVLDESSSNDWPYAIALYLDGRLNEKQLLDLCSCDDERADARSVIAMSELLAGEDAKAHDNLLWLKQHATANNRSMILSLAGLKDPSFLTSKASQQK